MLLLVRGQRAAFSPTASVKIPMSLCCCWRLGPRTCCSATSGYHGRSICLLRWPTTSVMTSTHTLSTQLIILVVAQTDIIVILCFLWFLLRYNWYYHTLPQAHMDNRVMYWPRGRVWGGSSSLNAMVYIRGHAEDYNRWQKEGAEGWDYEHCLPYFRKAQTHELGENRYRPPNISGRLIF